MHDAKPVHAKRRQRCRSQCSLLLPLLTYAAARVTGESSATRQCHRKRRGSPHASPAFLASTSSCRTRRIRDLQPSSTLRRARQWAQQMQPTDAGSDVARGRSSDDIAVHDDSWYLGDGGFAQRHIEDEGRVQAQKTERDFFRERSLSVYDQMREASMLLLAQQQVLAAEEAREEASKPRFVAAAGTSQAARAQAARERQKKRDATAGRVPPPPLAGNSAAEAVTENRATDRAAGAAVGVPSSAGALSGRILGVGGLDEELDEIRRRVCVPLAAPGGLLEDLGISPVRGLLLHGPPGCGKTLLARRLSAALTLRPPTVVSGPEVLERFVGSSEANIRALFDYPPEVAGASDEEEARALHVIVLDEFDSIGQKRGGGDDGGDRVRDSVVNQLLARMDGFQELVRPTLLIALTNRIDLLDNALLRPGRFEVQVEIPGPDQAGREAILRIHTQRMHVAGRIETTPADGNSATAATSYDSLISSLAAVTDGFTGAELAGLVRAAASYALERAVGGDEDRGIAQAVAAAETCRVTTEDFGRGLADISRSQYSPADTIRRPKTATVGETRMSVAERSGAPETENAGASAPPRAGGGKSNAVSAATVATSRPEIDESDGLRTENLAGVQELLRDKINGNEDEEALLLDAAQEVAQRRRTSRGGTRKGKTRSNEGGKERKSAADGSEIGKNSTAASKPRLKKFEHTGWFHTYE